MRHIVGIQHHGKPFNISFQALRGLIGTKHNMFPGAGTAFQCDVGMSGPYESIIGRDIKRVMKTTRTFEPSHFHVAKRDVRLCGAIIQANEDGRAESIERFEMKLDQ